MDAAHLLPIGQKVLRLLLCHCDKHVKSEVNHLQ